MCVRLKGVNIVLVGEAGCGNTSLLNRFAERGFAEEGLPNIGIHQRKKASGVPSFEITIWDAGHHRSMNLPLLEYIYCRADVLVTPFDLTVPRSILQTAEYRQLLTAQGDQKRTFVVAGTKCDLTEQRQFSFADVATWRRAHPHVLYVETSAKLGIARVDNDGVHPGAYPCLASCLQRIVPHLPAPLLGVVHSYAPRTVEIPLELFFTELARMALNNKSVGAGS